MEINLVFGVELNTHQLIEVRSHLGLAHSIEAFGVQWVKYNQPLFRVSQSCSHYTTTVGFEN